MSTYLDPPYVGTEVDVKELVIKYATVPTNTEIRTSQVVENYAYNPAPCEVRLERMIMLVAYQEVVGFRLSNVGLLYSTSEFNEIDTPLEPIGINADQANLQFTHTDFIAKEFDEINDITGFTFGLPGETKARFTSNGIIYVTTGLDEATGIEVWPQNQ